MAKKKGRALPLPSLDEQLAAHDAAEPRDGIVLDPEDATPGAPSADRRAWARRRLQLVGEVRHRDSKRMRDPGPDEGGRMSASPYVLQHGHVEEVAPKDLGKELPKDSQFPKRIATQRMIDRYETKKLLTARQWRAGDRLWRIWRESGRDPSLIGNYSPTTIRGTLDPDRKMIGRTEAVADWEECRRLSGVLGFSALVDVVIWDRSASDWARSKGHSARVSADIGMAFLRGGLDVLAAHFRY